MNSSEKPLYTMISGEKVYKDVDYVPPLTNGIVDPVHYKVVDDLKKFEDDRKKRTETAFIPANGLTVAGVYRDLGSPKFKSQELAKQCRIAIDRERFRSYDEIVQMIEDFTCA